MNGNAVTAINVMMADSCCLTTHVGTLHILYKWHDHVAFVCFSEESRLTTWLHPVDGQAVQSGNFKNIGM